jgi:hypothetical protein
MAIELEFFIVTGPITGPVSDIVLKHPPSTGPNSTFDIAVDPIGGPAQVLGIDYGITGSLLTGILTCNLEDSDIPSIHHIYQGLGETGPILRVLYNYDTP